MEQGALKGICLAPCGTPGDPCPAAAGQLSACAGVVSGQNVCLYLCQLDGKSYACPDPVGFVCKVQAAVPQASLCVPAP
jgi:hypothetical protein